MTAPPSKALGPQDLGRFMEAHGIPGEILELATPVPTVLDAAEAVGARPEQIVKSILFLVAGEPVLAISCGTARVDRRVVAAHHGVGRKQARLADPQTVQRISGFTVGAMPPFGHRQPLPTLLDTRVLEQPVIYAGGGSDTSLVRLDPRSILEVNQAELLDLHHPPAV